MTMISTRRASSLRHAAAIAITATVVAGTASACSAAASSPLNVSVTGWQDELVNRPGCWTEGRYDNRYPCDAAGWH
jgi:hypothetical protein